MDWLEQNLDAYRIIAEILDDLRETLRSRLDAMYGREWYKDGLPSGMLERLVGRKEEEKAIDWYESEYQQVMSYALFPDLLEILEHNAEAFPQISGLAPTSALLNARFLELEVMRGKLGRARPISETELSFLGTFHLRFRKAIEHHRAQLETAAPGISNSGSVSQQPAVAAPPPAGGRPKPPPVQPVTPPDDLAPEADTPPPSRTPAPPADAPASADNGTGSESPPVEVASPDRGTAPESAAAAQRPSPAATGKEPSNEAPAADGTADAPRELGLKDAIEAGDDQAILRELYKEVTAIAEGIWTKDIPPPARVWDMVSVSEWYENGFSPLGLRPLSDFYDIIAKVDLKMREGASKEQLQDYLKEANFAQTLLALRDMFQKNHI